MRSLIGIGLVVTGFLVGNLVTGQTPLLGLDLQGGVEVVLQPEDVSSATPEALEQALEIIRTRVDALGVAEPDITLQGTSIVAQLPGVEDQERAVGLIGQTAELRFRPVLEGPISQVDIDGLKGQIEHLRAQIEAAEAAAAAAAEAAAGEAEAGGEEAGDTAGGEVLPGDEEAGAGDEGAGTGDDSAEDAAGGEMLPEAGEAEGEEPETGEVGAGGEGEGELSPDEIEAAKRILSSLSSQLEGDLYRRVVTPAEDIDLSGEVILTGAGFDGRELHYRLGPALFTGAALEGAQAVLESVVWQVRLTVRAGPDGIDKFNEAARACFNADPDVCPNTLMRGLSTGETAAGSGRLAVVLDHVVQSAPAVNAPSFERDQVTITGNFTEQEARELALVLDYGALPLEFADPAESGLVRTVSATLGRDDLTAGVVAGIIGLVLVAVYMLSYYRLLGLAAIGSLAVSGTLLWVVLSFLSSTRGLALTLAGVTGLIVAIGVSLDSNVIYFEHLKEDIRSGRTLRSAVEQAFPIAFKTIFWANLATLIGAGILWLLTIGSVRGFAAMLGIASILDLVATYFFLRPVVRMLARRTQQRPALVGMPPSAATVQAGS